MTLLYWWITNSKLGSLHYQVASVLLYLREEVLSVFVEELCGDCVKQGVFDCPCSTGIRHTSLKVCNRKEKRPSKELTWSSYVSLTVRFETRNSLETWEGKLKRSQAVTKTLLKTAVEEGIFPTMEINESCTSTVYIIEGCELSKFVVQTHMPPILHVLFCLASYFFRGILQMLSAYRLHVDIFSDGNCTSLAAYVATLASSKHAVTSLAEKCPQDRRQCNISFPAQALQYPDLQRPPSFVQKSL